MGEHREQCYVIQWAEMMSGKYPQLEWLMAIPSGAKLPYKKTRSGRFSYEAMYLKQEGALKPGISDLFLPYPNGRYCGLFIEMKYGKNKPTKQQMKFIEDMNRYGYLAVVCYGAESAIEQIEHYLTYKKRIGQDEQSKQENI